MSTTHSLETLIEAGKRLNDTLMLALDEYGKLPLHLREKRKQEAHTARNIYVVHGELVLAAEKLKDSKRTPADKLASVKELFPNQNLPSLEAAESFVHKELFHTNQIALNVRNGLGVSTAEKAAAKGKRKGPVTPPAAPVQSQVHYNTPPSPEVEAKEASFVNRMVGNAFEHHQKWISNKSMPARCAIGAAYMAAGGVLTSISTDMLTKGIRGYEERTMQQVDESGRRMVTMVPVQLPAVKRVVDLTVGGVGTAIGVGATGLGLYNFFAHHE